MLARIGVKVDLLAQTKAKFFAKGQRPKFDTDFCLICWTPATYGNARQGNRIWNLLDRLTESAPATCCPIVGKFEFRGAMNRQDTKTPRL
jgi:peptide/nickel transport system substrate-binding protein